MLFQKSLSYLFVFSCGFAIWTGIGSANLSAQATKQLKAPGKMATRVVTSDATNPDPIESDIEISPGTGNQSYSIVVEQVMKQFPQFRGGPHAPHFPGIPPAVRPPHLMPPGGRLGRPDFPPRPVKLSEYWIGTAVQPIPEPLAEQLDIPADQGVMVIEIVPNSPAEQAGLKRFDIITRIGDAPVNSVEEIGTIVDRDRDKPQQITYLRKGKEATLELTPQPRLAAHSQQEDNETDEADQPNGRRSIRIVRPGFIVPATPPQSN